MVLALHGGVPAEDTFALAIELVAPESKSFVEYNYVVGAGVNYVSGPDNSAKQSVLRFVESNEVVVYINGVRLGANGYDRSINNRISLKAALTEDYNTVKVVVFTTPAAQRKLLTFTKVAANPGNDSAWHNAAVVDRYTGASEPYPHTMFYCSDFTSIRQNTTFTIARDQYRDNPHPVKPDAWHVLLSNEPHTHFDRDVNHSANMAVLIEQQARVLYEIDPKGQMALTVDREFVTPVFPPMRVSVRTGPDTRGDVVASNADARRSSLIN
jgi:hypothetical protein